MEAMDTKTKKQITDCLAQASPPVVVAYLFGSTARAETTPLSDVDIAVFLDEPRRDKRVAAYLDLRHQLEQAIADGPVDLILLNDAPPPLAGRIIAGQLVFCTDEQRRIRLETEILSRYQDLVPVQQQYDRFLHDRILNGLLSKGNSTMVDPQVVNERLGYIQTTLQQLQSRKALPMDVLKTDVDKRNATLYELQTCIEAMSDIANHIIAATGLRKPQTRGEAFIILAEAGVISSDLAQYLVKAVGMRNVLVHGYLDVLLDLVYQALQNDLPKIEAFTPHIVNYLKNLESGSKA